MAINLYDTYDHKARETANANYVASPEFKALEREAAARGYRHATLGEIHASAESAQWAPELFCWRGGLWAKQ